MEELIWLIKEDEASKTDEERGATAKILTSSSTANIVLSVPWTRILSHRKWPTVGNSWVTADGWIIRNLENCLLILALAIFIVTERNQDLTNLRKLQKGPFEK